MASENYSGQYTWNIKEFLECEPKQRKTADSFNIGDLPFTLECYPNGDNDTNIGSFMLYCTLLSTPDNYKEIILNLRFNCKETNSSFTSIAIFTSERNSAGWSSDIIKLNELKELKDLTIGCNINILKIIGIDNDIIYEYINKSEIKPIYNLKWTIDSNLMNTFKTCRMGKSFESEIFDNLFCLRCLPNGKRENDKGNVKLYLLLCGIPSNNINNNIHISYTLWCNVSDETDTGYNSKIVLNYEYPTVGWPNEILSNSQIQNLESLTFNAEIEIIDDTKIDNQTDDDDDDSSTYSSSSSLDYGVKGVVAENAYDENDNDDELKQSQIIETKNDNDNKQPEQPEKQDKNDEIPPEKNEISPPQISPSDVVFVNKNDNKNEEDNKIEIAEEKKQETEIIKDVIDKKKKKHIHKHHKNKKRLTIEEFKSVCLEDLIENDVDILDNYDIAKKICKFFDKQFDDTDTVCMVAEQGKQPTISYWVKGEYVRKHANVHGKHILVYRASKHVLAKKPIVSRDEFEKYVKKISKDYENGSVNTIADKLDAKFGTGCHYARSSGKSSQYDIYCRFSDKYECGFKLPSGKFVIAWRR